MKGVILAAGKGTRLYPITKIVPKPLLPLANKPTILYAFERLAEIGVQEICIVVGENEPQMRNALGSTSPFDQRLTYAVQTEPKGLAHAMSFARETIGGDDFVMYLGDEIYTEPLTSLAQTFAASRCANLNMVKEVDDPRRFGIASVNGNRITKLVEKPTNPDSNLALAGLYFFTKRIWDTLKDLRPSARGEYEITDAIQILVDWNETVLAGVYSGGWFDTGTLDSFLDCSNYLLNGGTLIDETAQVSGSIGGAVCVGESAVVECESIQDCVVLPGADVRCEGEIRHCILAGTIRSDSPLVNAVRYSDMV